MQAGPAAPADAATIDRIYNGGIEERIAPFETRPRTAGEIRPWFGGRHPVIVVENGGGVVAFAAPSEYRPGECYAGVAEFSAYAERAGFWKLVSRVFVENTPSRRLLRSAGFREIGVYEKHARLDSTWKDVGIVERLLPSNL